MLIWYIFLFGVSLNTGKKKGLLEGLWLRKEYQNKALL